MAWRPATDPAQALLFHAGREQGLQVTVQSVQNSGCAAIGVTLIIGRSSLTLANLEAHPVFQAKCRTYCADTLHT